MTNEDRDRQFRLRPPRPRRSPRDEGEVWSLAFKRIDAYRPDVESAKVIVNWR